MPADKTEPCAMCDTICANPLAPTPTGEHLWFVPRLHGYPNIRGDDESCAKCGKMRGPVNESRPCRGPVGIELRGSVFR